MKFALLFLAVLALMFVAAWISRKWRQMRRKLDLAETVLASAVYDPETVVKILKAREGTFETVPKDRELGEWLSVDFPRGPVPEDVQ